MRGKVILLCASGLSLFISGFAAGQRARVAPKFDKYQGAANISAMDWALLQAKVNAIGDTLPGTVTPPEWLEYDKATGKITAIETVGPQLANEPLESVRRELTDDAGLIVESAQRVLPEVTVQDVEVQFRSWDKTVNWFTFAEFRNGEVVIRSR